jgi:enamine deaminase RidA (YjgF/YER057c/UK114 family)
MTATDETRQVVGTDIATQARFIYRKMSAVLAEAGASLDDVVQTTDYVTTLDGYGETAAVRREVFGDGPYPAATGVVVAGLVRPGALIEISAVAWVGGRP